MEKGFALKQDFKHLSPYECGLGWAVAADKDFIGKEAALARKEHPKYRMVGLEFSRESTEDISIWERVYWYGVEVGRCAQTIYGYTVDKNIGLPPFARTCRRRGADRRLQRFACCCRKQGFLLRRTLWED